MGSMMNYTDGHIVRLQLAALTELGLRETAVKALTRYEPALAALWAMGEEGKYNYDAMAPYAVKELHYQLQTAAVMAFRNHLSYGGSLADLDQPTFVRAFGDLPEILVGGRGGRQEPLSNGFMAFAWDPDRLAGDQMWAEVDKRLEQEWSEGLDYLGRFHVTFPSFLWDGYSEEQKLQAASHVLKEFGAQAATVRASATPVRDRVFRGGRRRFALELMSATICPADYHRSLKSGQVVVGEAYLGEGQVARSFTLTEDGFYMEFRPVTEDA